MSSVEYLANQLHALPRQYSAIACNIHVSVCAILYLFTYIYIYIYIHGTNIISVFSTPNAIK
jgi:hypothetical protein